MIGYLEEPLLSTDESGYHKLLEKMSTSSVKIGSKKVFESKINVNVHYALYRYQDFKTFSSLCEQWKALNFKESPT